jgi:glycosyltransferase involved in cell wall biosynthesis
VDLGEQAAHATVPKPRLVCLVQLPPPVHGASLVNESVVNSEELAAQLEIDVVPLRFASSVDDLGRFTFTKLVRAAATGFQLAAKLLGRPRPIVYFTLSISGAAFYRDACYVALMRAFAVARVYHLHGKGIQRELTSPWKRWLGQLVFRGADVIVLSRALQHELEGLVPAERLHVVPNGIADQAGHRPARADRTGCPRILFLSNMIEDKGPLVLVEALALLKANNIEFKATFVGAHVERCIAAFNASVARHGLEQHVAYLGPVFGSAKHALFREHDVFAFPTYYALEAFPLVVLEAMQWELPIVTTAEGAIAEIVQDGETGFIVAARDPVALAARLQRLLLDSELRALMGRRARARFLEHYTLKHFERRLGETLIRCVASNAQNSVESVHRQNVEIS